jgi:hypothetical protein
MISNTLKSMRTYVVVLLAGVFFYFSGIAHQIFERSLGNRLFSGRDSIWSSFFSDFIARNDSAILVGSDLSRHLFHIPEIIYVTSDVHNTFFDIANYYGLSFLLLFTLWYIFSSGLLRSKISFLIIASYLPVLLLSSVFKFPFAFYSSVLILILPIYLCNTHYIKSNTL